jgi:RNA polymerase sigma-70 factor, ECF subfamily
MDPDRTLVERAAAGDDDAFGELVRRHQVRVFTLARALTGDDGAAEDVAQETFIRVFRGLRRFRGESAFRTWLYRIVVNVARSHGGRRVARQAVWQPLPDRRRDPFDPAAADPEAGAIRRQAIDAALGSLSEEMRAAVTLRDIEGLDYADIAVALGVPIGTVESRIFRGRQRLRELLRPLLDAAPGEGAGPTSRRAAGSRRDEEDRWRL